MGYDCRFEAILCRAVGYDLVVGVDVPITTVCPCSKVISVAGAHNQRAWLRVKLRTGPGQVLWIEDLVAQLEAFGSCEIYPLVKRPDEKYVTEKGYFNPKFVEDVLRDVVVWLRGHPLVTWFEVECEADESFHLHNAFAYQLEPLPPALNVFTRDLDDAAGDASSNGSGAAARLSNASGPNGVSHASGASGASGAGHASGASSANGAVGTNGSHGTVPGHALPDVASRSP